MRTLITWTLTLVVAASASGTADAQGTAPKRNPSAPASKPARPPVDPAAEKARLEADRKAKEDMNPVLAMWEVRSKQISSLDVVFERVDVSPGWGDQFYQGRAMLQSPDLACLQFRKFKLDPKGKPVFLPGKDGKPAIPQLEPEPFERIVCTGKEVLQYSWDDKKIFIFPLDKQSRQKALQQGPLPFLFNMKADDLKKRYEMRLLKQDEKDFLIGITPKEDIDRESFSKAFLWLNKTTYLPNQLWLFPVGDKEHQEFRFAGESNTIVANSALNQDFFKDTKYAGWKVIDNPGGDAAQQGQPANGVIGQPPKRAAAQPANKPTTRPR